MDEGQKNDKRAKKAAKMPLSLYSEHYFAKKMKKICTYRKKSANFVRFLFRMHVKAEFFLKSRRNNVITI